MVTAGRISDHIDWDALRTALHLARAGSVRKAARDLGVSHSTVLRRVGQLEASTGVRLFERKPEGYALTPAGQDVFDTASEVEEVVLALARRVEGRDLRLAGTVRVTLPDPFLALLLPAMHRLSRAHPQITVTLAVDVGFANLGHREADVAIRVAREPPLDLVGKRVGVAAVGIYGSARYLRGRSTRDLAGLRWIGWDADSSMVFERWRKKHVPDARVAVRVSTASALRDAVDADLGVSLFPCAQGGLHPSWRRVRVLPEAAAPIWILTHADLRTTARVRVVRDALEEALSARRGIVEGRTRLRARDQRPSVAQQSHCSVGTPFSGASGRSMRR